MRGLGEINLRPIDVGERGHPDADRILNLKTS
jgi:hypothetical protein